ncbi:MAG: hypothetical protein AAB896_01415 [Patescibacteria group bacterium]
MKDLSERTTIYLTPQVKQFLKHAAVSKSSSVSKIIDEQFAYLISQITKGKKASQADTDAYKKAKNDAKF